MQSKHAHLLRWKRFSEHTSVIETLYPEFKNRLGFVYSLKIEKKKKTFKKFNFSTSTI